ncbi:pentapeptide repeat-containing protein [Haladaptatus sp. GCM10025707]|uniref:pentapeptide repeat-containing protein n=1 Tax=Haladaptatus sp. GCM10025707 TaxID=3252658 RepID=UPI003611ECB1
MTVWVFPGDESFLETTIADGVLRYPEPLDIESGDPLIVYRIDTAEIVGPFVAAISAALTGAIPDDSKESFEIPFDIDYPLKVAPIENDWRREDLAAGGAPEDEFEAEILLDMLDDSKTVADVASTDDGVTEETKNSNEEPLTLHAISKSREQIIGDKMDFSGSSFGTLQLEDAQLRGADLSYSELAGTNFRGANLQGADLRGAELKGADFTYAKIKGADFRGANLTNATLTEDLAECRFSGAILDDANLRRATLEGVDLSGARLEGTDLTGTFLESSLRPCEPLWRFVRWGDADRCFLRTCDVVQCTVHRREPPGSLLQECLHP